MIASLRAAFRVVALVLCLVGVAGAESRRDVAAFLNLGQLTRAIDEYRGDVERTPPSIRALVEDPGDTPGWAGPYLMTDTEPMDPWGQPFVYRPVSDGAGTAYRLYSKGANARDDQGRGDDITSWAGIPEEFYPRSFPVEIVIVLLAGCIVLVAAVVAVVLIFRGIRRRASKRRWCCLGMESAFADRNDTTIFVYAEPPHELLPQAMFWIAVRSIRVADRARVPKSSPPFLVSTKKGMLFCPWCGVRLRRFYRRRLTHLVDPAIAKELEFVPPS